MINASLILALMFSTGLALTALGIVAVAVLGLMHVSGKKKTTAKDYRAAFGMIFTGVIVMAASASQCM